MDVRYNSVLGDIVWTGGELEKTLENASRPLHVSLNGVFSPVPVLYCNSRWLILQLSRGQRAGVGGV